MNRSLRALLRACVIAAVPCAPSCFSLDSFLYTSESESAYALTYSSVFPASLQVPTAQRAAMMITGQDGTVVACVWATQSNPAAAPTVIYSHGQSSNIDRYWERASLIYSLGANVLIYDYPSYGLTPGTPSEATVYATGYAAVEFVHSLGATIDQTRIFQYGFSLGTGPATQLALATGPTRGLVLEAPYTSMAALVADGSLVLPRSFVLSNQFDNIDKIQRAATNATNGLLILHGDSDTYVQTAYGIQLDAMAGMAMPPVQHRLVLVPGADHGEVACAPPGDPPCIPRASTDLWTTNVGPFLMQ